MPQPQPLASTPTTPLTVAIVGAGVIGRAHARVAVAHPALNLVAVIDSVTTQAEAVAEYVATDLEGPRPQTFPSLAAALASTHIDLVAITTPSGSHAVIAEEAIAAGLHVVIEKPIDVHLARARRISELAEAARERGITVSVISQNRFSPTTVAVKRAIDDGRFGRVTSATVTVAWWRSQEYYDSGDWRGTWQFDGGGALMNQGVHAVDQLLHFLGRPVEVFGYTALLAHERVEVEDVAASVIRFESGAFATLLATTNAFPENATRIQVHGSTGSAFILNNQLEYFHADDAHAPGELRGYGLLANQAVNEVGEKNVTGAPLEFELFEGHLLQYEDILEAIQTGREPGVTVAQATEALALVHTVYVSQMLGTPVKFADVLNGDYDELVLAAGADTATVDETAG
ncbi:Gfo/Idh/MocA family protein [Salinibacterium sp. ZJ450]|uniref:Gfo/Idh/MocA family protein n=1 Tax=Salinibacterium sp. ZJ450 TaxID=2708338 RepID=UPI00141D8C88|nr:Gfo/Idh/MocA family oxidoreductase [Salinibacterium sp. ZJ450]